MIREAIFKLVDKQDLTYDEAYTVIREVMEGQTTPVQTAAFLAALSTKSTRSETIDEISGCAEAMRSLATPMSYDEPLLEIVGTGGDRAGSFNISTTAAIVIAAGGVKVGKHGNRAPRAPRIVSRPSASTSINRRRSAVVCSMRWDSASSSPRTITRR